MTVAIGVATPVASGNALDWPALEAATGLDRPVSAEDWVAFLSRLGWIEARYATTARRAGPGGYASRSVGFVSGSWHGYSVELVEAEAAPLRPVEMPALSALARFCVLSGQPAILKARYSGISAITGDQMLTWSQVWERARQPGRRGQGEAAARAHAAGIRFLQKTLNTLLTDPSV